MLFRSLSSLLILIFLSFPLYAAECLDIFPGLSQNYGPQLNLPSFKYSSESDGDREGGNLALSGGQYKDVKVDANGSVYFTELNTEYRLKKLELGIGATAQFVAGDYWIEDFKFEKDSTLTINGGGTVRIYVGAASFAKNAHINDANGLLIFISYSDFSAAKELNFTGVMYAQNNIAFSKDATIIGSITGGGVSLGNTLSETYQETSITNADFNGMCDGSTPTPIANYRFDECAYTGVAFDAFDQTGNYSATSQSSMASTDLGAIERAANISNYSQHFTTSIPITGDFSISTWFKKPTSTSDSQYFVLAAMQSGGDLLVLDRNNSWRWGVYDGSNWAYGTYSFAAMDANWHHLAVVYQNGISYLIVDGVYVDSINLAPSGTIKYIGTSLDFVNTTWARGFRAPIDEFMVYNQALSVADVQSIYNNQLADKNYDSSTRAAVTCDPLPIANYRLDECAYTGSAADTLDQIGSYSATSHNSIISLSAGAVERAADISNYDQHFTTSIPLSGDFTVATWFKKPTSTSDSNIFVLGSMQAGGDLLILDRNNSWKWGIYNGSSSIFGTYSFASLDNNWHHMIIMYQSGISYLVIDGVWVDTINLAPVGTLQYIGTSLNFVGTSNAQGFRAPLDEFMVFNQTLTLAEMQSIYNNQLADKNYDGSSRAVVSCTPVIDHYLIEHNGQGLTCETERVAVRACTNVYDGSTCVESSESTSLNLVATGGTNSVSTTTAFVGSTIVEFDYTVAENITLSITNENIGAINTTVCNDNNADSCNMAFENAGFIFTGIDDIEVAGVANTDVTIQAVKDVYGVCTGLFDEPKNIEFAIETVSPSSISGDKYTIGSNEINLNLANNVNNYKTVSLNFGADSVASLSDNTYFDAGDITLHAKHIIAATPDNPAVTLVGSATFYVRPYEFKITATNSDNQPLVETLATGAETQKAGVGFNLLIEAVNLQGNKTANFTNKSVEFSLQRTGPTNSDGGVNGTLTYSAGSISSTESANDYGSSNLLNFTDGEYQDSSVTYSEVGLLNMAIREQQTASNAANHAQGSQSIGRFIPDHFTLTANMVENACDATNFTYMGQPSLTLTYEIEAQNLAGHLTQNYVDSFIHSTVTFVAENATNGIDLGGRLTDYQGSWTGGKFSPTSGALNEDVGSFSRNTVPDGPYEQLNFGLKVSDTDGSVLESLDMLSVAGSASAKELSSTLSKLRFGRWTVENSSGPETSNLSQPMYAQYLASSGQYITNTDDSCSSFSSENNEVVLTNGSLNKDLTSVTPETSLLVNGYSHIIELTAPGAQGDVNLEYTVPSWLQFDWLNIDSNFDGPYDQNPSAVATFGVYRGNDRIISWREVGN